MHRKTVLFLFIALTVATTLWASDTSETFYRQGNQFYLQGQYAKCVPPYQAAIAADPNVAKYYQALGGCEFRLGQKDAAIRDYQTCLRLDPNNPALRSFLTTIVPAATATLTATQAPTPAPSVTTSVTKKFESPLPKQGSITWTLMGAVNVESYDDFVNYYGSNLIGANTPLGLEFGLGADYTIIPQWQVGLNVQGIYKLTQPVSFTAGSETEVDTWTDLCLGPALDTKYLLPLDRDLSLVLEGQIGYYFLVDASYDYAVTGTVPFVGAATLSGSSFGELLSVGVEWLTEPGWAVDLGLSYRYLRFFNINASASNSLGFNNTGAFENENYENAYMDFSGPRVSLAVRFF